MRGLERIILVPVGDGAYQVVRLHEIVMIYTEAYRLFSRGHKPSNGDGNYTHLILLDGTSLLTSKQLGVWKKQLSKEQRFFQPHQAILVNLGDYFKALETREGMEIILFANGKEYRVPIALRRKNAFWEYINGMWDEDVENESTHED